MNIKDKQSNLQCFSPLWAMLVMLTFGLCAMGVCVWLGGGGILAGGFRFDGVWDRGPFRMFVLLAAVSLIALTLLSGWLVRVAGRAKLARGGALSGQDGTAILEFAMVLPIALAIVMLMLQASLLMGGYLCVNYASYTAARAAVVYVPDDMPSEPANVVEEYDDPELSGKLSRIHMAAVWAVMPVSDGAYDQWSDYSDVLAEGIEDLYSQAGEETPGWVTGYLGRKLAYAEQNTRVSLSPPVNGLNYAEHEDLHVVVTHNLYLSVPYASRVLAALSGDDAVDFGQGRYALRVDIPCTLRNEGVSDRINLYQDMDDLELDGIE